MNRLLVAHHHGFKCAGSTVVHLLNRNWPEQVLHVEHRLADQRIYCDQMPPLLEGRPYKALTSHLLAMPAPGQEIAHVHFGLVRDPIERLVSTYKFVPEERRRGGFRNFIEANRHHACDYHLRHLGVQGRGAIGIAGWQPDPAALRIDAPHVLLGLVERFADTMFLLERRIAAVGGVFDGSVGGRHNVGKGDPLDMDDQLLQELREQNAGDYLAVQAVGEAMDRELARVDPDGRGRAEHLARCEARTAAAEPYLGKSPLVWAYLPA